MLEYLLITFAGIFVIVNPLTTAFVFMSLLSGASDAERQRTAGRATLVATSIFFTFALLGGVIFQVFGITLEAFRIAGGLILSFSRAGGAGRARRGSFTTFAALTVQTPGPPPQSESRWA